MIPNADGFSSDPSINYIGAEKQCEVEGRQDQHFRVPSQNRLPKHGLAHQCSEGQSVPLGGIFTAS